MPLRFNVSQTQRPLSQKFPLRLSKHVPVKPGDIREEWESRTSGLSITPDSKTVRLLLAKRVPHSGLNGEIGDDLIASIPGDMSVDTDEAPYHFVPRLNEALIDLPASFFLQSYAELIEEGERRQEKVSDTALSHEGLSFLMHHLARAGDMTTEVFMKRGDFCAALPRLLALAKEKPIACLVSLHVGGRHMTGIYLNYEADGVKAYFFDTTGFYLPPYSCGLPGYPEGEIFKFDEVLGALHKERIMPCFMPISTARSIQSDPFSCLMATVLFFLSMKRGEYKPLDSVGMMSAYGGGYFSWEEPSVDYTNPRQGNQLFTTTSLELLAGCQGRLSFLLMMDSVPEADTLFPKIAHLRAGWSRKPEHSRDARATKQVHNVFWQVAYFELLRWLEMCHLHADGTPALPDFSALLHSVPDSLAPSEFESRLATLQPLLKSVGIVEDSAEAPTREGLGEKCDLPSSMKYSGFHRRRPAISWQGPGVAAGGGRTAGSASRSGFLFSTVPPAEGEAYQTCELPSSIGP